jgi:hypothetical protein
LTKNCEAAPGNWSGFFGGHIVGFYGEHCVKAGCFLFAVGLKPASLTSENGEFEVAFTNKSNVPIGGRIRVS